MRRRNPGYRRRRNQRLELHVFDFDGTLFRSPPRPEGYPGPWWAKNFSLEPPCVPMEPGPSWWVENVVRQARKSIASPNVYSVMCTARSATSKLTWRIADLLRQQDLDFEEVILNEYGVDSRLYKQHAIGRILQRFPQIEAVQIWEDDLENLATFVRFVEKNFRIPCIPHPIVEKQHPPDCDAQEVMALRRRKRNPRYARKKERSHLTLAGIPPFQLILGLPLRPEFGAGSLSEDWELLDSYGEMPNVDWINVVTYDGPQGWQDELWEKWPELSYEEKVGYVCSDCSLGVSAVWLRGMFYFPKEIEKYVSDDFHLRYYDYHKRVFKVPFDSIFMTRDRTFPSALSVLQDCVKSIAGSFHDVLEKEKLCEIEICEEIKRGLLGEWGAKGNNVIWSALYAKILQQLESQLVHNITRAGKRFTKGRQRDERIWTDAQGAFERVVETIEESQKDHDWGY